MTENEVSEVEYEQIINRYRGKPGGLLEAYIATQQNMGHIPEEAIRIAASTFNIPVTEAYGVATFYSHLKIRKNGKYVIRICKSAPCHMAGSLDLVPVLEKHLGIKVGETTADGKFTLEYTECIGQCHESPVISINSTPYGNISADSVSSIINGYNDNEPRE